MPKIEKALRRDRERDKRYNFRSDNRKSMYTLEEIERKRMKKGSPKAP